MVVTESIRQINTTRVKSLTWLKRATMCELSKCCHKCLDSLLKTNQNVDFKMNSKISYHDLGFSATAY